VNWKKIPGGGAASEPSRFIVRKLGADRFYTILDGEKTVGTKTKLASAKKCCELMVASEPKSWNVEANDGSGWAPNGLFFATKEEADAYGRNLMWRWLACRETRPVPSHKTPNCRFSEAEGLQSLPAAETQSAQEIAP
jgi:hypothetical protein